MIPGLLLSRSRVRFAQTYLSTVVCQLRYHPLLRLDQPDAGVILQDAIGSSFPIAQAEPTVQISVGRPSAEGDLQTIRSAWRFHTADRKWRLTVGAESVALETLSYVDFEDFLERFMAPLEVIRNSFGSPLITRVGIRKVNLIPTDEVSATTALRPEAVPLLQSELAPALLTVRSQLTLAAEPGGVNVTFGMEEGARFRLDIDRFDTQETELPDAIHRLPDFSQDATDLFRWFISEELEMRMGPEAK